jgi:hypothetical protein
VTDQRFAVRLLVIMFTIVIVGFGAEFLYDFSRAVDPATGQPLQFSDLQFTPSMIRSVTSPIARAYNNTLALILTFIGLAIPITANMYTPKLIEIFVRDKVNLFVLCLYAVLTAHSILAVTLSFDKYAGVIPFWITFIGAIVGWTMILPYYFYVLGFLNPTTIIQRVKGTLIDSIRAASKARGSDIREAQDQVNNRITHLGSVLLRAVDRADRDVAIDAVKAHVDVLRQLRDVKKKMDGKFFDVGDEILVGMSRAAVNFVVQSQIWIEQKLLGQMILAFNGALGKMPDGVSSLSDAVKVIADEEARRGSPEALDLQIRVLNTFLREALKKKDTFSIYNVLYNYKSLAKKLLDDRPDKVPELARHLKYYAEFSRIQGVPFIYELTGYELGDIAEYAYDHRAKQAEEVLEVLLALEGAGASVRLVKARVILGSYFLQREKEYSAELARIVTSLEGVPVALLAQARKEITATTSRIFWEVTDRGINLDYVDDERKKHVYALFDRLEAKQKGMAAAATPAAVGKAS